MPLSRIPISVFRTLLSQPGVTFLYSERFDKVLRSTAIIIASVHDLAVEDALEEFRRFIALKVFVADSNATKISPTPIMDELWHAAILNTAFYRDLQVAVGITIDHNPNGATDGNVEGRRDWMRTIYRGFFKVDPLDKSEVDDVVVAQDAVIVDELARETRGIKREASGSEHQDTRVCKRTSLPAPAMTSVNSTDSHFGSQIFIISCSGSMITININDDMLISTLALRIGDRAGVPVNQFYLIFGGTILHHDRTVRDYYVAKKSTLHMIGRLKGC